MLSDTLARLDAAAALYDADGKRKPQSRVLVELAQHMELFHDEQGAGYAIFENGHREVWPVRSPSFSDYLARAYYRLTGSAANRNAISETVDTLAARARFDCPQRRVYNRVARTDEAIYIDLVDGSWRVVRIDGTGWCVLEVSPVMFVRSKTAAALPLPETGGSLDMLRALVNVSDEDWPLVVGWILNTYGPGPYLLLVLFGEQGTAKSTMARMLKSITDPSTVPLRAPPKDEESLLISAQHSWVLALDNLSGIAPQLSDALCRLSTGGGFGRRRLYTDSDEVAVDLKRPCILNGIDDIASRPDLSERSISLYLRPIARRVEERALKSEFDQIRSKVFGAICNAISAGIQHQHNVDLDNAPRMVDAAAWITACEHVEGRSPGAFLQAFQRNQLESAQVALESSPVTAALLEMMNGRSRWSGTATALLDALIGFADDDARRSKAWPKSGDWLTKTLMRFGRPLRSLGLDLDVARSAESRRIEITNRASSEISRHGVIRGAAMTRMTPLSIAQANEAIPKVPSVSSAITVACSACDGEGCAWCGGSGRAVAGTSPKSKLGE